MRLHDLLQTVDFINVCTDLSFVKDLSQKFHLLSPFFSHLHTPYGKVFSLGFENPGGILFPGFTHGIKYDVKLSIELSEVLLSIENNLIASKGFCKVDTPFTANRSDMCAVMLCN